jgi:hypothetical protein
MASLCGVYESHTAVAGVDAGFELTWGGRGVLHNRQHQENKNN